MLKFTATILYYVIISPLLLIGVLPVYLVGVVRIAKDEKRWLGIKEFQKWMNEPD